MSSSIPGSYKPKIAADRRGETVSTLIDRSRGLGILLVFILIGGNGCGAIEDDATRGPGTVCDRDDDCPGDQSCQSGYCTVDEASSYEVDLRFFPPNSSRIPPQMGRDISLGTGPIHVALEPNIEASGCIEISGRMQAAPDGNVLFSRNGASGAFTSRSGPVEFTSGTDSRCPERDGEFNLDILPGSYDVTFLPDDRTNETPSEAYPPVTWLRRKFEKPRDDNSVSITNLSPLPSPSGLATINGALEYTAGSPGETGGNTTRLDRARVYAVGADDSSLESTVAVTDPEGNFTLKTLPEDEPTPYDLIVGPSARNPFVPKRRISGEEISVAGRDDLVIDEESSESPLSLQGVDVGRFPQVIRDDPPELRIEFEAPELDDEGSRENGSEDAKNESSEDAPVWTQFRVRLRSTDLREGTFSRTQSLSEDGTVSIAVLPVEFEGKLIPPSDSKIRPKTFTVDSDETLEPPPIELELKKNVEGRVLDSRGEPLVGAQIEWRLLSASSDRNENRRDSETREPTVVRTDSEGRFDAWLEPRAHQVLVVPPTEEGQPRTVTRIDAERIENGDSLSFNLAPPLLVRGRLFGEQYTRGETRTTPVSKTTIEVYDRHSGLETMLGRGTTDAEGRFHLIVPASEP